jgi:hypothetical protein
MAHTMAGKKVWIGTRRRMFVDQTIAQAATKGAVVTELRKRYKGVRLERARDWFGTTFFDGTGVDRATGEVDYLTVRSVRK